MLAGLAYGLWHAAEINAPYSDPGQVGEPGFAAFGACWLGIIVGGVVLVLFTAAMSWLGRRYYSLGGISRPWLAGFFAVAWIGACSVTAAWGQP